MLTFLLITHNDAEWLEKTWNQLQTCVQATDRVCITDGGSSDETPTLLRHLIARHPLPADLAGPPVFLPQTQDPDFEACRMAALTLVTDASYVVWMRGTDQLHAAGVTELRAIVQDAPVGIIAPQTWWYGEPGVDLGRCQFPDWGGTILPHTGGAGSSVWPSKMTNDALWEMNTDLIQRGARCLDHPISARKLSPAPASTFGTLPVAGLIARLLDDLDCPGGTDTEWNAWTQNATTSLADVAIEDLEVSVSEKAFLQSFKSDAAAAHTAILQRRLHHGHLLHTALLDRILTLGAAYDATKPDAEKLIRAYARMRADAAALEV